MPPSSTVEKPWILLTNDDGADSPALVPLIRALSPLAEVHTLVPATERSWTSKIMSRFGRLQKASIQRQGCQIHTLDGYPADCANLGIHLLRSSPPALVVSGINLGSNVGLAYFLSSGTIGAAVEASLCGVPAAAFSIRLKPEDNLRWRRERNLDTLSDLWQNGAIVARDVVAQLLAGGLPEDAALLSVNMPPDLTPQTPRRFTKLTPTGYGSFFGREKDHYEYRPVVIHNTTESPDGDIAALDQGIVSLTPIRFGLDIDPNDADQRRFER